MHGSMFIKFINAKQAVDIHAYKNTKRKLCNKLWNNKFYYKAASCWYFYWVPPSCLSVSLSVCQSACNNSASTRRILMKSDIVVFFENLSRKFKFHQNLTRITAVLYMKTNVHFFLSYLDRFFLEWEMFQTKFVKKTKTHILHSITFFFLSKIVPFMK